MALTHGTARPESARLVPRRIAPGDLPFYTWWPAIDPSGDHGHNLAFTAFTGLESRDRSHKNFGFWAVPGHRFP